MRRLLLCASVLVATAGCSGPSLTDVLATRVLIEPEAATYLPGDTVRIYLRNLGQTDVEFSWCPFAREHFVGVWTVTASTRNCADVGYPAISPGESRLIAVDPLPNDAVPGLYRWRFASLRVDRKRIASARSEAYRVVGR